MQQPAHAATPRALERIHRTVAHNHSKRAKHAKGNASAQAQKPVVIVSKEPHDAPDFDWMPDIAEAQALLAKLPADKDTLVQFNWHLAVKCGNAPIGIVSFKANGAHAASVANYRIAWPIENGINTRFTVKQPVGCVVLAQKRVIHTPTSFTEAVYTAYSLELDTKTMRDAGFERIKHLQRHAYQAIKDMDVRSRVRPNQTVAELIPSSIALRLIITEHIDPLHMKFAGIEQCIHEVLFTIAANDDRAYSFAVSSAGARGLPQFMEDSYRMVRANYPAARLEPNFINGMNDQDNAVLAQTLLFDLELTEMPQDQLSSEFLKPGHVLSLSAFLAAGYNCNPVVVVREYLKTHVIAAGRKIPFETRMYVKLQQSVAGFLHDEYSL